MNEIIPFKVTFMKFTFLCIAYVLCTVCTAPEILKLQSVFLYNLSRLNDFIGQKCLKLKLRSAFVPKWSWIFIKNVGLPFQDFWCRTSFNYICMYIVIQSLCACFIISNIPNIINTFLSVQFEISNGHFSWFECTHKNVQILWNAKTINV